MKSKITSTWKAVMARVFVVAMVVLAVAFVPTYTAQAATAPTLSKKSVNVLIKNTYDLNVKNKIKGSTYEWSSSNSKIATVNQVGLITGKSRGDVVISCKITTPDKKEVKLSCKLKVVSGAKDFAISNKVAILNKGQVYDLNRTLKPFTSNDVTTWTSSDASIAKPDAKGKFTAKKAGTVTITGTTLSGKSDSVTIKIFDQDGSVATQADLEELLKAKVTKITLRTDKEVTFTIPEGNYKNVTLAVDAPKADIYNNGVFKAIEIYQVAPSTFHENAKGNKLVVKSGAASIDVAEDASVSIEITSAGAKVTIKNNNGEITNVVMMNAAELKIEGESKNSIPVEIKAEGAKITTSVPMAVTATVKAAITLEKGAEATTIAVDKKENIPTIAGNVTVSVAVGTGTTQEKVEVKGEPIPTTGTTPSTPAAGGSTGGGSDSVTPDPGYSKSATVNGKTRYTLTTKTIEQISKVKISFIVDNPITVDGEMLRTLKSFLNQPADSYTKWMRAVAVDKKYGGTGNEFEIHASAANGSSRTITLTKTPISLLNGREYVVTLNGNPDMTAKTGSFTISSASGLSLTVTKIDDKTLDVETNITGLTFVPEF